MQAPSAPTRALCRAVGEDFVHCLRRDASVAIDVDRARRQHEQYVEALRDLGVEVEVLPALPGHPDAPFVEDAAVITGAHALITRPGAPSREAETATVAEALGQHLELVHAPAEARIDGGDVLRWGPTLFVGLSSRTDEAGLSALRSVAELDGLDVVGVPLRDGLHLKSACTIIDADTLIAWPGCFDFGLFEDRGLTVIPASEHVGANVLALGDVLLASDRALGTVARLRERGHSVRTVPIDMFEAADAALSCLSLRLPPEGAWSV